MFTFEELSLLLMWICLTAIGAILIGIVSSAYILGFAVKKTKTEWIKAIALSLIVLVPSIALIWFGILHSFWNTLAAFVFFSIASWGFYSGIKDQS